MEQANEAVDQIDNFLGRMDHAAQSGWDSVESLVLRNDVEEYFKGAFGENAKEYRSVYHALHPPAFSGARSLVKDWRRDVEQPRFEGIRKALLVARHRVQSGQSKLLTPPTESEWFVEPGTPHSAYVLLRQLLEDAKLRVLLQDHYVGKELLPVLHNIRPGVTIQILTQQRNTPKDFAHELGLFSSQYGKTVEARFGADDFHDRFLVVDDRLLLSGASFKDLGKKGSVVTEIQDSEAKTSIMTELQSRWDNARPIP